MPAAGAAATGVRRDPRSSAALARAVELSDPVINRASSVTRSACVSLSTAVRVRPPSTRFETAVMRRGMRGQLRRMRHAEYLIACTERTEALSHPVRGAAADARVDLVEHEGLAGLVGGCQGLQGEHDSRQLAARRDFRQRSRILAGIGGQEQLDPVRSERAPAPFRKTGLDPHFHVSGRHGQVPQLAFERRGKLPGPGDAPDGQRSSGGEVRLPRFDRVLLQRRAPLLAAGQILDLRSHRPAPFEHRVETTAVVPRESLDVREPCLRRGEPVRRRLDRRCVGPECMRKVLEQRDNRVPDRRLLGQSGIERRQLVELPPHRAEGRQHRVVPLVQRRVGAPGERQQPVGVGEAAALVAQELVLSRSRSDAIDLLDPELQELDARRKLPRIHPRRIEAAPRVLPARAGGRDLRGRGLESGVGIQESDVRPRIQQCLVLMLAVDVDEPPAQRPQRRRGRECVVQEHPAAALGRDFAADDGLVSLRVLECRLDEGPGRAGANQVPASPLADQQAERADDDRLAGAGLAGQHVEAVVELDVDGIDDGEVANAEETDHDQRPPVSPRSGHPAGSSRGRTVGEGAPC